ncbi:MAG: hypothetical protein K9G62_07810 [Alphaproteobacteria bacterium]|nr:hypothetical protein [Alphaproteobacteria bacterium]
MTLVFGMTAGRIQEVDVVRVSKRMGKEGTVSESYVRPARPTEKKDRKPKI